MWPLLLDMTKEESIQCLRNLELEAYSTLVSALRAQGPLNPEKRRLLKDTGITLSITNERHKAEIRRAINDEKLNTIAYHITGQSATLEDWAQEGRRLVPLLPRVPPQTSYSVIADEVSDVAGQLNKQLPLPSHTDRKRPITTQSMSGASQEVAIKTQTFRVPDVPKDDMKKRKISIPSENSSLAQHLLGPNSGNKLSKIQQIYRQTSKPFKPKQKEMGGPSEIEHDFIQPNPVQPSSHAKLQQSNSQISQSGMGKVNIIQNIALPPATPTDDGSASTESAERIPISFSNPAKVVSIKPNVAVPVNHPVKQSSASTDPEKIRFGSPRPINKGQKLIVVSNAQTITSNSILQKTLSVPMSKVTKLNLDKFKIIPSTIQVTAVVNSQSTTPAKHNVVTLKSNHGKKVIPLSHFQMLNSKGGIKVLPLSGKILGKTVSVTSSNSICVPKGITSINKVDDTTKACNTKAVIQPHLVENGVQLLVPGNDAVIEDGDIKTQQAEVLCENSNESKIICVKDVKVNTELALENGLESEAAEEINSEILASLGNKIIENVEYNKSMASV
ncbi:BRCA2-interacting transcriptional repressor EMSY [Cylas formicarius]|uniref:BRCA2-interacting transcriptional repressor EMSY n=1 Tax=Cylas formicarius TaxID=197179 RepID=UPI002958C470|nr:BRCA2-interacting transcriptional repressor EMSY [Cylas formicarius]